MRSRRVTDAAVQGTVVRAPIVAGEPITETNIVHADAAGFMAATVTPGMRAMSINVTTDTSAGGFILPNDRVDVIITDRSRQRRASITRDRPRKHARACRGPDAEGRQRTRNPCSPRRRRSK